VEVADLNRDGLADLIGGNATGSLVTRFGNGNFTFRTGGSFTVPDQALNTKLADLNGDGNADVVFNGGSSNVTMYVMLGNADGTFGSVSTLASTAGDNNAIPIIMDFDGDGVLDIAASDTDAGAFNIFLGRSQRTTTIARLDLATQSGALAALSTLDATLQRISAERGAIGASLSRVSSSLNTLGSTRDNYAAASSRIKDVDVALETGELSRKQILQQSAQAILAQANQIPTLALSLLRDI
jgi:flagellin-like hook-associated protein FlgL